MLFTVILKNSFEASDLIYSLCNVAVLMSYHVKQAAGSSYLSNHSVPNASDQLSVLAICDQVEVVGKLNGTRQLFQDVDAEALTAQFCVRLSMTNDTKRQRQAKTENVMVLMVTNSTVFGEAYSARFQELNALFL